MRGEEEPIRFSECPWRFLLRPDVEDPEDLNNKEFVDKGSQLFTGLFLASLFGFVLYNFK